MDFINDDGIPVVARVVHVVALVQQFLHDSLAGEAERLTLKRQAAPSS